MKNPVSSEAPSMPENVVRPNKGLKPSRSMYSAVGITPIAPVITPMYTKRLAMRAMKKVRDPIGRCARMW